MAKYHITATSPSMPRMGNWFTRKVGDLILRIMGWKITGKLPDEKKVVVIGAPHTSNYDFIIAMASMQAVGLRMSYMMKKEAFFFPLAGFFKWMGGVPIDRSRKTDIGEQMTNWFNTNETAWLGITPEGTRSKVDSFRKGYLKIAHTAGVPVFIIGIDGNRKEVVLDKLWPYTDDLDLSNTQIKNYYDEKFIGINPDNQ